MPWSDNYRRIWKIQVYLLCLRNSSAFSALTPLVGWQEGHLACKKKLEWWGAGAVICLERGADLHMAQLMPLPLTVSCFSKTQIGFPFWYRLTRFNVCVCVIVPKELEKKYADTTSAVPTTSWMTGSGDVKSRRSSVRNIATSRTRPPSCM